MHTFVVTVLLGHPDIPILFFQISLLSADETYPITDPYKPTTVSITVINNHIITILVNIIP